VPICNNGGANATAVAEHALLLMLAVNRKLVWQHENVVAGRWRGNDFSSTKLYELEDKTLGIVGLGNIGKKVARRAKAFDMRVQYYDINRLTGDQEDALGVRFVLFPELLKTSDVVSLHVPLDKSTTHMVGKRELEMMKPTAIIVNTCRGPVIDEKALYEALRNEVIGGAGLDVFDQGADRARQPDLHAPERDPDAAFRGPHLGQPLEALPQRLRQCRARRARPEGVLDRARAALSARLPTRSPPPGKGGGAATTETRREAWR